MCEMSSHVGMLIADMNSALLIFSGRIFFLPVSTTIKHFHVWNCGILCSGFLKRYCLVLFLHYANGNFDTNTSKESTQVWSAQRNQSHFSFFFTLDAQCVSPQISKWFWGLKGKVLKYFSTGGLIPRLGTSTSIPWVQSTAQGKKERKEMGSLRICILRGKRSKN